MQDRELYAKILGVREPWRVEVVDLDLKAGEVIVRLTHEPRRIGLVRNVERRAGCTISPNAGGVIWTPVSCGPFLRLSRRAATVRITASKALKLPWAEPGSRFTAMFERLAIDWLLAASQKAVAERLHLSWDEIHAIQERAVKRGAAPSRSSTSGWTRNRSRAAIITSPW